VRADPGPDRSFGNVHREALADHALRIAEGVAEVVGRDRFEDHSGRVGFISSCGCGELVETLSALEYLEDSESILSPSFLDGKFCTAPRTRRVLLLALDVWHGEGLRKGSTRV